MSEVVFSLETLKAASTASASIPNDQEFSQLVALGEAELAERRKRPGYIVQNDPLAHTLATARTVRQMIKA